MHYALAALRNRSIPTQLQVGLVPANLIFPMTGFITLVPCGESMFMRKPIIIIVMMTTIIIANIIIIILNGTVPFLFFEIGIGNTTHNRS
jgi:hypothetical protein